jgi:hypothetical protein
LQRHRPATHHKRVEVVYIAIRERKGCQCAALRVQLLLLLI